MSFSLDSSVPARGFDAMLKNASKHRNRNNTFIVFFFFTVEECPLLPY